MQTPLLEMKNITKSFPGVKALDGVSFDLNEGEIHALVGENGAGKSTLMKILAGVYPHPEYGGEIMLEGAERRFANIREAERAGIAVIYQELSLVKELSVAENIFLGREPRRFGVINWEQLYGRVQKLLPICIWKLIYARRWDTWVLDSSSWSKLPKHCHKNR